MFSLYKGGDLRCIIPADYGTDRNKSHWGKIPYAEIHCIFTQLLIIISFLFKTTGGGVFDFGQ